MQQAGVSSLAAAGAMMPAKDNIVQKSSVVMRCLNGRVDMVLPFLPSTGIARITVPVHLEDVCYRMEIIADTIPAQMDVYVLLHFFNQGVFA